MRVLDEQRLCGHDHPRCAETALDSSLFDERLLERRRLAALRQPLDRRDGRSFRLHCQHKAAGDRPAVHDDRTCTTLALVAADLGAEKPQVLPQDFGERPVGLCRDMILRAVDLHDNTYLTGHCGYPLNRLNNTTAGHRFNEGSRLPMIPDACQGMSSAMNATSTGAFIGRDATPTAKRAW